MAFCFPNQGPSDSTLSLTDLPCFTGTYLILWWGIFPHSCFLSENEKSKSLSLTAIWFFFQQFYGLVFWKFLLILKSILIYSWRKEMNHGMLKKQANKQKSDSNNKRQVFLEKKTEEQWDAHRCLPGFLAKSKIQLTHSIRLLGS